MRFEKAEDLLNLAFAMQSSGDGVSLAEGPWSADAYRQALQHARHFAPRIIDYGLRQPRPLSRGPYAQDAAAQFERAAADQPAAEPVETPAPGATTLPSPAGVLPAAPSAEDPLPSPPGL